ncbi:MULTISPECIES: THUMP-like domain-containing protein [unclassified Sphingobacterium]|uniref:THUMP-like domain-containing protein n=1 Tax=unclassified Sphingobacterium TaxID=2609468 RepID=UPI0025E60D16|nr:MULTISPECIES: class I SAM-dependent methyltransferase [unclassified Sphingobacterium]
MNTLILQEEIQQFLDRNAEQSPAKIALKKSPFEGISPSELATQLDGKQRASTKIPLWANTPGIYFPPKLNLEQCSSEKTALFKSTLINKGTHLVDVTSGFGVDSFYFSRQAAQVTACELNPELAAVSKHNAAILKADNLHVIAANGVDYILDDANRRFDYIYLDPSRRVQNKKVFLLDECEPNLVQLQDDFFQHSTTIISKLAPLLDISSAVQQLRHVKDVYVISVQNDCKELVFVQEKDYEGDATVHAVRLFQGQQQVISFTYESERAVVNAYSEPLSYLYEPDVALSKAGAFKIVGQIFNVKKLHKNTHLYTSDQKIENFPGKTFLIKQVESFTDFKKNKKPLQSGIIAKNFPLKTEEIKKKFKIKDAGDSFVFFTTTQNDQFSVIHTQRMLE